MCKRDKQATLKVAKQLFEKHGAKNLQIETVDDEECVTFDFQGGKIKIPLEKLKQVRR